MNQAAAQRPRRGRKPVGDSSALTKDVVVAAALRLLDEKGLKAFSVRDLAAALDVFPAAVYWHVQSRNRLLSEMVAHVMRNVTPPPPRGAGWQDWIRVLFERYRQAIQGHPNIAPLIGAELVSNTSIDLDHTERVLQVLEQAGFTDMRLVQAFNVLNAAQVGFVTLEFAPPPQDGIGEWSQDMQALVRSVDPERHPLLGRNMGRLANHAFTLRWENGTTRPMDQSFRFYVEAVIAGLERLSQP